MFVAYTESQQTFCQDGRFVRKTFCQDRLRVRGCRWLHVVMGGSGVVMDGCMALRVFFGGYRW